MRDGEALGYNPCQGRGQETEEDKVQPESQEQATDGASRKRSLRSLPSMQSDNKSRCTRGPSTDHSVPHTGWLLGLSQPGASPCAFARSPPQMEPQVPWCQGVPLSLLTGPVRTQVEQSPEQGVGIGEDVVQQRGQTEGGPRDEGSLALHGAIISLDLGAGTLWSQPESRAGGLGSWLVPTSSEATPEVVQKAGVGGRGCSRAIPLTSLESPLTQLAPCACCWVSVLPLRCPNPSQPPRPSGENPRCIPHSVRGTPSCPG